MTASNRLNCSAWGQTGGVGGMRLVPPPLRPEGPEGPAKQEAAVAPPARHQSTVAGGSWSSVPPFPPPLHEHPTGKATGGVRRSRGRRDWVELWQHAG